MRARLIGPFVGFVFVGAVAAFATTAGLVDYEVVDGGIPEPLTDQPGDSFRGWQIVRDASNATCLICHAMPIPDEPNHGNIGPDLTNVGERFTAAQLRLRIVDPKMINPATVMPSYYRLRDLNDVEAQYAGQTIYSAQDVEDVVAYLLTLRGE